MSDETPTLSDKLEAHDLSQLGDLPADQQLLLRIIHLEFRRLQTGLDTARLEAEKSRILMEKRLDLMESHLNPDSMSKRAEQDAQHRILWNAAKVFIGTIATALIVAILAVVGVPKP